MPLVVNPGFDPDIIHAVLKDLEGQRRAIESMLQICKESTFIGIQIDFEHIHVDYRDLFTQIFSTGSQNVTSE